MVSSDLMVAASSRVEQEKAKEVRVKAVEDAINNLMRGDVLPEQITEWSRQLNRKVGGGLDIVP